MRGRAAGQQCQPEAQDRVLKEAMQALEGSQAEGADIKGTDTCCVLRLALAAGEPLVWSPEALMQQAMLDQTGQRAL